MGVAVDSFGNVYFSDTASRTVSVVYRGGTRVADFVNRVNPAAVAYSGWVVQVGYVYHIAGEINLGNPVKWEATSWAIRATPSRPLWSTTRRHSKTPPIGGNRGAGPERC